MGCSACQKGEVVSDYEKYKLDFNNDLLALSYPQIDFSETKFIKTEDYKTKYGADAYCFDTAVRTGGEVIIYVSDNMKIYNDTAKKYLIYHEFGHCFYGKQHVKGNHLMSQMIGTLALWYGDFNEENRLKYLKDMIDNN